ncbi:TVP38/TMEM64 family protein [Actinokineospora fastidiosa]|uniref:TVP38/TMEM64 family membrane protein n=1 Tax=Actinokineospora fastidiosa TaxID=1816 RepID=A0A918L8G3_9PSEU|nr:TVP38/TMEM64 family protein [Actinokineospora fastidiosa]
MDGVSPRATLVSLFGVLAAVVAIGFLVPIPSPAAVRDWAAAAGWATPALFLLAYSVLAAFPIPRTVFNLSAGLLLGEALGVAVGMVATGVAGSLAFAAARRFGRRWTSPLLEHGAIKAVDARLRAGGFAGVVSLRLIPVVPFAPVNYCCGLSTIGYRPYLWGTLIGSLPGTAAAVVLGDALTGTTPPALLAVYGVLAVAGGIGLYRALKRVDPELVETA